MSSIHIEAKIGEIAETILLPGDPIRAKFVAEHLLSDVSLYNDVRGMLGYTGFYKGKKVSVQGTGMGMGSAAIYINELIRTYKVKQLIRIGTFGALQDSMKIGQVLLALSASGDSSANALYFNGMQFAATADFELLMKAYTAAQELNINTLQGSVFSTDTFYDDIPNRWEIWEKHNILGVEMETQILYTLASRYNVKALSILTASDNIKTGIVASADEREQHFTDMTKIALELV